MSSFFCFYKGLIEPPQIIPLNDEFLTAFGKREKEFDKAKGITNEFEQEINSDEEDSINNDGSPSSSMQQEKSLSAEDGKKKSSCSAKVKIANLAYRTSQETLTNACLRFGTLVEVHLVLDKDQPAGSTIQNSGRAYVTFDSEESAQACIDGLTTLDGRSLRVNMAAMRPKTPNSKGGGGGGDSSGAPVSASLLNKMMQKDISTVCFRCGEVGHIEAKYV
jgi:RNA recognition motif-containing protein